MLQRISNPAEPLIRRELLWAVLLIALATLLLHCQGLAGHRLAGEADTLRSRYPLRHYFWSLVAQGNLPAWTPVLKGGFPLIVEEDVVPLYPPEWVFGLFRTPAAFNWMLAINFWLAGLAAYWLARALRISIMGAALVAIITLLGAPLVARVEAGHTAHLYGRVLMIWQLLAIVYLARQPNWWRALSLGLIFGSTLLIGIGIYQMALYTSLLSVFLGLYLLVYESVDRRRFVAWAGVAVLIGLGLGAARTLITLDVVAQGNRQGGLDEASYNLGALPVPMVFGYALPYTFDDPDITDYAWPENALYVGAATLLLAFYAVRHAWNLPQVRWWAGIAVLFLWLALGTQAGLFRLFVKVVPGYALFRNPSRHAMITGLGLAMLAGYGLDQFLRPESTRGTTRRSRLFLLGTVVLVLIQIGAALYPVPDPAKSFDVFPERLLRGTVWFVAALLAFVLATQFYRARRTLPAALLIFGTVVADLACYAVPIIYRAATPTDLAYITPENFPVTGARSVAFFETDTPDSGQVNATAESGLVFLNAYSSVIPQRLVGAANLLAGRAPDTYLENEIALTTIARPDLLDLFGVQWLIVGKDVPMPDDSSLREGRDFGPVRSIENPDALPFAFVVPDVESVSSADASLHWLEQTGIDYRQHAVIEGDLPKAQACPSDTSTTEQLSDVRLEGGNLWLTIESPQAGLLVINQTYMRGWEAWINDHSAAVFPTDHRWSGVYLPCAGRYRVHLRYLPSSLIIGVVVTGATILMVAGISFGFAVQKRSRMRRIYKTHGA